MKISDEELRQHIELGNRIKQSRKKHKTSLDVFILLLLPALKELQQLREERRWHKIEELKTVDDAVYEFVCQQCENKATHLFYSTGGSWETIDSRYVYPTEKMKEQGYKLGRLLPMDLPEVE